MNVRRGARSAPSLLLAFAAALAACALPACGPPPDDGGGLAAEAPSPPPPGPIPAAEEAAEPVQADVLAGPHPHLLPLRLPGAGAPPGAPGAPAAAQAGPRLRYYGGHVISQVRVYVVFWGDGVDATTQARIGDFFRAATDSPYFDWLSEYDTDRAAEGGQPGTGQHIGRGSYGGSFTIAPQDRGDVTNDGIQAELARQIGRGALPPNDDDALYMIYFPPGVSISLPDGNGSDARSCQQFCAFHNTMQIRGRNLYYGVMPDLGHDLLCQLGCGRPFDAFDNLTQASSHEMIEAVTDAEVGLAQSAGPPLGWYDFSKDARGNERGEIGDICNGERATLPGPDGSTFAVQKEWSNRDGACIDARPGEPRPPAAEIVSPREGARVSGRVPVSARAAAGAGASLRALRILVDGEVVAERAAAELAADWDASAAADGPHELRAVAIDSAGRTGQSPPVHVVVEGGGAAAELVRNGGFEGSLDHWTLGGKPPIDSVVRAHRGSRSLRCGATPAIQPDGDSFAWQAVAIPAHASRARLTFWTWAQSGGAGHARVEAQLRDEGGAVLRTFFRGPDNSRTWKRTTADVSAFRGRTVRIYFAASGTPADPATLWVDDVSLRAR